MSRPNQNIENVVQLGIAAAVAGYKIYQAMNEEPKIQYIPFPAPNRFPKDSKIYLVNTIEECRRAMRELKSHCNEFGVLGFDCKWIMKPGLGGQKVALLQLASHRGLCVLVRLSELQYIPPELKEILVNRDILKVGFATSTFSKYLFEDYFREEKSNPIQGAIELGCVAAMAKCDGSEQSLASMCERDFGHKRIQDTSSNWEAQSLCNVSYAATDAMIAIELFKLFAEMIEPTGTFQNRMKKIITACSESLDKDEYDFVSFGTENSSGGLYPRLF